MKFVDTYDLRARVLPALLCVMPATLALWSLYGDQANWWGSGITIAVSFGFAFLMSRVAREAGKRLQDRLFREWGGSPTEQLLRHRDHRVDRHSKAKLHERLGRCCGIEFPTAAQEIEDPNAAEDAYRAAARWLLHHTRDTTRYALLFKENVNFGFQRNALGLRWVGVAIALVSAFAILVQAGVVTGVSPFLHMQALRSLTSPMALALLLSVAMLATWLFAVTPVAAKRTAFSFAERLIEATDTLE